jgi:hypothetical protein
MNADTTGRLAAIVKESKVESEAFIIRIVTGAMKVIDVLTCIRASKSSLWLNERSFSNTDMLFSISYYEFLLR